MILFQCRSLGDSALEMGPFSNRWVHAGVGAILGLRLGFAYLPFVNVLFGSAPLGPAAWGQSLLVGAVSPLVREHVHVLGRYQFTLDESVAEGGMRPLRDPSELDEYDFSPPNPGRQSL